MNSRSVNKAINKRINPLLQSCGFVSSTVRNYRRYKEDRVEVINFQSFNSYLAERVHCTTFSFSINLGIYFLCVPHEHLKFKDGKPLPEECDCNFRKTIQKNIKQNELRRRDIFYIASDGSNLEAVMDDAFSSIQNIGITWFAQFNDMNTVLRVLINSSEDMQDTWGFGNNPSPMRSYLTGFVANSLCQWEIAEEAFKKVIDSKISSDSHVARAYEELTCRKNA